MLVVGWAVRRELFKVRRFHGLRSVANKTQAVFSLLGV